MISLAIGDLRHNPDYAWLGLTGTGLLPGLVGAIYDPRSNANPTIEERITLVMKGTPAQISTLMQRLEEKVAMAERYSADGVGTPLYLRVCLDPVQGNFYARLLHARLEPKPNSLQYVSGGSLGIELVFTRENHFDGEPVALPLSNLAGAGVTTGLALANANDDARDNFFMVDSQDVTTELPAPLRLELSNVTADSPLKDLWVGSFQYDQLSNLPALVLEGESGEGGTDQNDASCSAGKFRRLTWSDAGWTSLLSWNLSAQNLGRFEGRALLPLLRLANQPAYSDLQCKLQLSVNGVTLYEGAPIWADATRGYLQFPALRLPPVALAGILSAQAHTLRLWGNKPGSTAYTLDVDCLHWLPLDSFSHYQGLLSLGEGDGLVDDAFDGLFYGIQDGYELATHIPILKGHCLQAGHHACFVVFQVDADGNAPIAQSLLVKAWYCARKRVL